MGSGDVADADAAERAVAEYRAKLAGEFDPPLTLTGRERKVVREALLKAYAALSTVDSKIFRVKQQVREAMSEVGHALAYLPDPKHDGGTS